MTWILLRIALFVIIFGAVFFGVRRIWRDWTGQFKAIDQARRQRDLQERERPDVVELKRSEDGVYRPGGEDKRRD